MYRNWSSEDWDKFEKLVEAFHATLPDNYYEVQRGVTLRGPTGATHEIDVLLQPRGLYSAPVIISCKFESNPVGPDHVREWATVVEEVAAAKGVIVSKSGFTQDAKKIAENPERRIELWQMRGLTESDFDGYIQKVSIHAILKEPYVPGDSVNFVVASPQQGINKEKIPFRFSKQTRDQLYLRDEQDNIRENLWDEFVKFYYENVSLDKDILQHTIKFDEPRFIVVNGQHLIFKSFSFEIHHRDHSFDVEFDALEHFNLVYENVITGETKLVPTELVHWAERSPDQ